MTRFNIKCRVHSTVLKVDTPYRMNRTHEILQESDPSVFDSITFTITQENAAFQLVCSFQIICTVGEQQFSDEALNFTVGAGEVLQVVVTAVQDKVSKSLFQSIPSHFITQLLISVF